MLDRPEGALRPMVIARDLHTISNTEGVLHGSNEN
jgi:hypothetical protein